MCEIENQTAMVTGVAGGIGAAVARALGERGATVAAVDHDAEGLHEVVEKLKADGHAVHAYPADVTDRAQVDRAVEEAEQQLGPIAYLVNAAGVLRLGEARNLTEEDWTSTFAVNTTGVFHTTQAVVNRMVPRGYGAIVTVASNAANTPRTDMAAYSASKAAATMFTKCLGLEVAQHGIRCNLVAPGSTDTPMLSSMWHDESGPKATIEGKPEAFRVGIPLGRIAHPQDIAASVVFLLSDAARHITMQDITVDGGAALGS